MKKFLFYIVFVLFLLPSASAQEDCDLNPYCEDIDLPLDAGASVLIVFAAMYGVGKLRNDKKNSL